MTTPQLTPQLNWLILGGCGYVGANLITHLYSNQIAAQITVADLKPPGRCFLPNHLMELFNDKKIEFIQSDLAQQPHVDRLFPEGKRYDIIVDCIAETRTSYNDETIHSKMVGAITKAIDKVVEVSKGDKNPPFFIEVSTAHVYDANGKAATEEAKIKPWTVVARAKYEMEQHMTNFYHKGLRGCIIRPALIYGGFNEFRSLAPRLCCAAVYQKTEEEMEFLWSKTLGINTVHVVDVCNAIIHCANHPFFSNRGIYNLADLSNTTQGSFNEIIEKMFGIKTSFAGTFASHLAKLKLKELTDQANESHQPQWLALCRELGIENTPYTTHISMELLYNNPLCIDGTAITKLIKDKSATQFQYQYPLINHGLVYQALREAMERNLFPKIKINPPK